MDATVAGRGSLKAMLAATFIQPRRITCDLLLAFFAKHLDQAAAPLLGGLRVDRSPV
jgi:hypothetical protein